MADITKLKSKGEIISPYLTSEVDGTESKSSFS